MAYDFPSSPTVGQVFGNYTWDGEKWVQTSAGILPSNSAPLMDGAATPGTSSLYTRADHIHPSDTSRVIKTGDTMTGPLVLPTDPTAALQAATKQYVDLHAVLPILSINGAMAVSQELGILGNVSVAATQKYVLDQFQVLANGVPVVTGGQYASGLSGFPYHCGVVVTTAQPTLAAADIVEIFTPIEGTRIARLGWGTSSAAPISAGFWINASITGTITVSVRNGAANRAYLVDVSIAAANIWQWVAITISGDVAGTWPTDTSIGLLIGITCACGTTFRGTAGAWSATNVIATSSTMNLAASTSNTIAVTGLIVVPGTILPPSSSIPSVLSTYDRELAACQRYWNKVYGNARFPAAAGSQFMETPLVYPPMRIAPAAAISGGTNTNMLAGSPSVSGMTSNGARFAITSNAAGDCYSLMAAVTLNARL